MEFFVCFFVCGFPSFPICKKFPLQQKANVINLNLEQKSNVKLYTRGQGLTGRVRLECKFFFVRPKNASLFFRRALTEKNLVIFLNKNLILFNFFYILKLRMK